MNGKAASLVVRFTKNGTSMSVQATAANWTRLFHAVSEALKGKELATLEDVAKALSCVTPPPTPYELWAITALLKAPDTQVKRDSVFGDIIDYQHGAHSYPVPTPIPEVVRDFAASYLSTLSVKRLFDPACDDVPSVSQLVQDLPGIREAVAFVPDQRTQERTEAFDFLCAALLGWKRSVCAVAIRQQESPDIFDPFPGHQFSLTGCFRELDNLKEAYDAAFGFPTTLGRRVAMSLRGQRQIPVMLEDNLAHILVLKSCCKLAREGVALFVLLPSFFSPEKPNSVYAKLNEFGICLDAFLWVSPLCRAAMPKVDYGLAIFKRGPQQPVFVGELQMDPKRKEALLENLRKRRPGQDASLGQFVSKDSFEGYPAFKLAQDYALLVARSGLPVVNLKDLLVEVNRPRRGATPAFDEKPNAVYLPSVGLSPAVTAVEDFQLAPENYIQLVLDPGKVNATLFANFLNSELGVTARKRLQSRESARISLAALRQGIDIPLPPLSIQTQILEADTRLRNLAIDIEKLRKELWARPSQVERIARAIDHVNRAETFEEWVKTLPFPLASILWCYHTAAHDVKDQFEFLLKFFEALAEFHATVLLSAAKRDKALWDEVRDLFRKQRKELHFENSSFGTWVELTGFLSKRFRELWNAKSDEGESGSGRERCKSALGTGRRDVIEMITAKKLIGLHSMAARFRNDYGAHFGRLGEAVARTLLAQLQGFLAELRSCFGESWQDYQLVLATNRQEWTGEKYQVVVNLLQGATTPFPKEKRDLLAPLKRGTLYLLDKEGETGLEILPLVTISSSPQEAENACYFYNRKQPDGLRYVSYHFEKRPEEKLAPEGVDQLFRELFEE